MTVRTGRPVATEADEVLARVRAMAPGLADRCAEIEQLGRLPDDVVAGLRDSGVFRLWLPAELGGAEASAADVVAAVEELSAADASTGWCAAIGLASNTLAGYLPEQSARWVYATGDEVTGGALMPTGRAVRQDDGFEVTGRWSFGSGAHHADWLVGGALVAGPDEPPRIVFLPRSEVELLDTWHVMGLRGTGSTDYQVAALRVPEERTISLVGMRAWPAGPMWRVPVFSLVFPLMAAVPIGIARRAVAELVALAVAPPAASSRSGRPAERESVQVTVARAQATVDAARALLVDAMTGMRQEAEAGAAIRLPARASVRLAAVHAAQTTADAVLACYRAAGTAGLRDSSPLQRALRDVNAATQHYVLSHNGYGTAGRVLLGLEPDSPL